MRLLALALAMLCGFMMATTVEARPHRAEQTVSKRHVAKYGTRHVRKARHANHRRYARRAATGYRYASTRDVGGRPRQWCGWWMRTVLGGGPEFNLAWNWSRYGSPTSPQPGAVVVWRHHVGIITGRATNGQWIVKSGNDGGQVRERPRSVAGAVFRI